MKYAELMGIVDNSYPDRETERYHDADGPVEQPYGDTLAEFIAIEIFETFDAEAESTAQLFEAERVIENAVRDLNDVLTALAIWRTTPVALPLLTPDN